MYTNKPLSYILGFTLILSSCSLFKSESNQKSTIEKDVAAISPNSQTTLATASTYVNTSSIDTIVWNELIHDFKDVPTGPEATTKFYFINKSIFIYIFQINFIAFSFNIIFKFIYYLCVHIIP